MLMEVFLLPLQQDDDQVRRNQNMVFLLQNGPPCNAVLWRTRNRCVELPVIMAFPMRPYVVLFLLVAKKTLDEFFSTVCVANVFGGNLADDVDALSRFFSCLVALVSSRC